MENITNIIVLILKAVAMAMAIASIVMGFFQTDIDTHITLLSIGLAALAIAAFM